MLVSALFNKKS